jgi:hypothetical protein
VLDGTSRRSILARDDVIAASHAVRALAGRVHSGADARFD